jgi:hypothetical protein
MAIQFLVKRVNADNFAGPSRIRYARAPLSSPEGVTVIGDTVILTDWSGGPTITRSEASGQTLGQRNGE